MYNLHHSSQQRSESPLAASEGTETGDGVAVVVLSGELNSRYLDLVWCYGTVPFSVVTPSGLKRAHSATDMASAREPTHGFVGCRTESSIYVLDKDDWVAQQGGE